MDKKKIMLELYKKYKDLFTDEFFKQHGFKILKYSYHTPCSRVVECSYEALVNTYHAERFAIANYRLKKGLSYLIKNRRNKKRYKIASRQK